MGKAFETPILNITMGKVASDLSTKQYFIVKINGATVLVAAAITDTLLGVLQNKPTQTGEAPTIMVQGISKVSYADNITAGDLIGTDSSGEAIKIAEGAGTIDGVLGIALVTGVNGDVGTVLLRQYQHTTET